MAATVRPPKNKAIRDFLRVATLALRRHPMYLVLSKAIDDPVDPMSTARTPGIGEFRSPTYSMAVLDVRLLRENHQYIRNYQTFES